MASDSHAICMIPTLRLTTTTTTTETAGSTTTNYDEEYGWITCHYWFQAQVSRRRESLQLLQPLALTARTGFHRSSCEQALAGSPTQEFPSKPLHSLTTTAASPRYGGKASETKNGRSNSPTLAGNCVPNRSATSSVASSSSSGVVKTSFGNLATLRQHSSPSKVSFSCLYWPQRVLTSNLSLDGRLLF